jgi:hypothetical protein
MSKHASTGYSFVAELTWGMPNGEIPCGSIRMVSQWDGIPVSYCASARAKRGPFGRTRNSGDQLRTRPESRDLDNVIFHAKRIAATRWFRRRRGPRHDHGAPDDRITAEQMLEMERRLRRLSDRIAQDPVCRSHQWWKGCSKGAGMETRSPYLPKAEGRGSSQWR